jgi:hypothetical protein
MKYCNDKEKTLIFIVFISAIAMMYIINNKIHDIAIQFIDDIVYNAKVRHVLRKCDECIEKQQKQQVNKENDDK